MVVEAKELLSRGSPVLTRAKENDPTLTYIHLHHLDVNQAADLAGALARNTAVGHLDLSGIPSCDIGDDGAGALAPFLRTNAALKNLLLTSNKIGAKGAASLAEALAENSALEWLDMRENEIGSGEGGVAAAPSCCWVFAQTLARNKTLLRLNLGDTNLGDDDLVALASGLSRNATMKKLDLECNKIGPRGAMALGDALAQNSGLVNLGLYGNKIGDEGSKALTKALQTNSSIETIELGHNGIGDVGAEALAHGLRTNGSIRKIGLSFNTIGNAGARAMACTIREMDLDHNPITYEPLLAALIMQINGGTTQLNLGRCNVGPEDVSSLCFSLSHNTTVTVIDLSNNHIGDSGATILAETFFRNETIESINLRSNGIGDAGAVALASALRRNEVIRRVNLRDNNNLRSVGSFAFAESLLYNSTVEQLVLRARGGRNCVSKAIKQNIRRLMYYVAANKYNQRVKLAAWALLKDDIPDALLPLAISHLCRECTVAFATFCKLPNILQVH